MATRTNSFVDLFASFINFWTTCVDEVEARDRSRAIADEARRLTGLEVGIEDVLEMTDDARFDGIWACAIWVKTASRRRFARWRPSRTSI